MQKKKLTDDQRLVLEELVHRLNGKCSGSDDTCPIIIAMDLSLPDGTWTGEDCYIWFQYDAAQNQAYIDDNEEFCYYPCPCYLHDFSVLDERIAKLLE